MKKSGDSSRAMATGDVTHERRIAEVKNHKYTYHERTAKRRRRRGRSIVDNWHQGTLDATRGNSSRRDIAQESLQLLKPKPD
uniref:Uncharacterized protein n=1 Tax=Angiostrongylus cantonensis TaxID=6313 RepID=A0A0K0CVC4_ANGCA